MATRGNFTRTMLTDFPTPTPTAEHTSIATQIEVDDDSALYIYVPRPDGWPPAKFQMQLDLVAKNFKEALPDTTVIVSAHDLKFTTITKKQVFKGKLDGSLADE